MKKTIDGFLLLIVLFFTLYFFMIWIYIMFDPILTINSFDSLSFSLSLKKNRVLILRDNDLLWIFWIVAFILFHVALLYRLYNEYPRLFFIFYLILLLLLVVFTIGPACVLPNGTSLDPWTIFNTNWNSVILGTKTFGSWLCKKYAMMWKWYYALFIAKSLVFLYVSFLLHVFFFLYCFLIWLWLMLFDKNNEHIYKEWYKGELLYHTFVCVFFYFFFGMLTSNYETVYVSILFYGLYNAFYNSMQNEEDSIRDTYAFLTLVICSLILWMKFGIWMLMLDPSGIYHSLFFIVLFQLKVQDIFWAKGGKVFISKEVWKKIKQEIMTKTRAWENYCYVVFFLSLFLRVLIFDLKNVCITMIGTGETIEIIIITIFLYMILLKIIITIVEYIINSEIKKEYKCIITLIIFIILHLIFFKAILFLLLVLYGPDSLWSYAWFEGGAR